ncbi:MAG TPA: nucleotidyltransferase domain-containing protein [Polyangiaceae bacterium]|nr:nucleotidyltransferase domain-containing protein [Polyangiaceae bacterium]
MDASMAAQRIADYYRERAGVAAVYLFGSVAKGTSRAESDVDVGVLYEVAPPSELLAQPFGDEAALAELFGRRVQIVVMNGAPPDLIHRILRDGVLVVERDKSRRVAFEVQARNQYFDLLPILRQYRHRTSA